MAQRIVAALMYAVVAVAGIIGANGVPQTVEGWIGLAITFVTTFWAKFSSSTTYFAPNRVVWTDEQRKAELAK